jgi:hypothetical protein
MSDGRLIDFEQAEVITPMIYPPQPRLVVSGVKPHPDVEVTLVPLAYVSQPPYHGIQVVATITADGPHVSQPIANVPYSVVLDLEGITGSEGIEVIGDSKTEQIALPSEQPEAVQLPADVPGTE